MICPCSIFNRRYIRSLIVDMNPKFPSREVAIPRKLSGESFIDCPGTILRALSIFVRKCPTWKSARLMSRFPDRDCGSRLASFQEYHTLRVILIDMKILFSIRHCEEQTFSLNYKITTSHFHLFVIFPKQRHPIRFLLNVNKFMRG